MKIGIFDSGYGGLTILDKIRMRLPQYDYIYLGDNARTPYGTRSFEVIYEYTLQAVRYLHAQGCRLIILACNTASAKALRSIQQRDINPQELRVLGVIRPTVEYVAGTTERKHIGILATPGTVSSESYVLELIKLNPNLVVTQQPCAMWVPIIEAGEHHLPGADYFVEKYIYELLAKDPKIDTMILGCTHYPLLLDKIHKATNGLGIQIVSQGDIIAESLAEYLSRHPEIARDCSTAGTCQFLTTESSAKFEEAAGIFLCSPVHAEHIELQ